MGEEWWFQLQLQKLPLLTSWICVEQQGVPRLLSSFSGEVGQAEMEETGMEETEMEELEEQMPHVILLDCKCESEGGILHWRVAE